MALVRQARACSLSLPFELPHLAPDLQRGVRVIIGTSSYTKRELASHLDEQPSVNRRRGILTRRRRSIWLGMLLLLLGASLGLTRVPIYSSPVFLLADPSGRTLYAADATASQVVQVDLRQEKVIKRIPLPERPSGLALSQAGDRLYVTTYGAGGAVLVIQLPEGEIISTLKAGHTPMAPVLSRNDDVLYVSNRFDDDLSVIDVKSGKDLKRIKVAREPVTAALTSDGKTLVVGNFHTYDPTNAADVSCTVSLIDTRKNEVVSAIRLPHGSQAVRGLCISPDDRYAFVTHILTNSHAPATKLEGGWLNTHGLSVIDLERRKWVGSVLLDDVTRGAANPWGVACSEDGSRLAVALSGTHEIALVDAPEMLKRLREFDGGKRRGGSVGYGGGSEGYRNSVDEPHRDLSFLMGAKRRVQLGGKGPRSVAISGGTVYAGMYFSESLEAVDLSRLGAKPHVIPFSASKPLTPERRGESLFNDATHTFQSWQSCSTCHHEARADGLNWDLSNDGIGNTKNTKSLLFSDRTPPLTMTGILDSLDACVPFELRTVLFTFLPQEDRAAMISYLSSMKPLPSPHLEKGKPGTSAQRGEEVFKKAKCVNCHKGEYFTSMETKNVGTYTAGDQHRSFDVPSLREVWRTAPYLHHGRAVSVRDVITKFNPDDRHGHTSELTEQEITDLMNYILIL